MRKAKDILEPKPTITVSFRLPEHLIGFLDSQVKETKIKTANRNKLVEGILSDWAKKQGMK